MSIDNERVVRYIEADLELLKLSENKKTMLELQQGVKKRDNNVAIVYGFIALRVLPPSRRDTALKLLVDSYSDYLDKNVESKLPQKTIANIPPMLRYVLFCGKYFLDGRITDSLHGFDDDEKAIDSFLILTNQISVNQIRLKLEGKAQRKHSFARILSMTNKERMNQNFTAYSGEFIACMEEIAESSPLTYLFMVERTANHKQKEKNFQFFDDINKKLLSNNFFPIYTYMSTAAYRQKRWDDSAYYMYILLTRFIGEKNPQASAYIEALLISMINNGDSDALTLYSYLKPNGIGYNTKDKIYLNYKHEIATMKEKLDCKEAELLENIGSEQQKIGSHENKRFEKRYTDWIRQSAVNKTAADIPPKLLDLKYFQ